MYLSLLSLFLDRERPPGSPGPLCGGDYAVGDAGGAATEELQYQNYTSGSVLGGMYGYSTATHDNRPPYYALCYIMKL